MGRKYVTTMHAFRKWVHKPRKTDTRLLAQFYFADEELIRVTHELDSFDGRSEPERCSQLIAELKLAQEKVIGLIEEIKNVIAPGCDDSSREFRVKFPDDILQDNLAGQLWFGAECLCAGSTIVNREQESIQLRPLAKQVVKSLSKLRAALREQALKNLNVYPSLIKDAIVSFDEVFAQFEFEYVSVLSRVRSVDDHDKMLEISVLFCETVERAVEKRLLKYEMIEDYDPGLMITIPRLAIICGVLVFPDGPLDLTKGPEGLPQMFKPFYKLLRKIRDLLFTLSEDELFILEKTLCSEENFDEVVLAAEEVLKGSNYDRRDSKNRDRSGRSRRFGSFLPELIHMPSSTYEANLGLVESNIREIQKKISSGSDCGGNDNEGNDSRTNSGTVPANQNLTIITEVEVHNNSYSDENNQSGSNSSSPNVTPSATLQNSNQRSESKLSEQVPQVSPNVSNSSTDTNSLTRVGNPVGRMTGPPDYPPPPYSSADEEDGYSSSNEGDSSNSNAGTSKNLTSVPEGSRMSVDCDDSSPQQEELATSSMRSSETWPPRPERSSGETITSQPFNSEVAMASTEYAASDTDVYQEDSVPLNSDPPQPLSPHVELVDNLNELEDEAMQRLLRTPEPEFAQVAYQQERNQTSDNVTHDSAEKLNSAGGNHDESGSSTSTLAWYKDSSSDTESEGLVPQKFHLLRSKFKCTRDLIHTLFVCISGVADQLQSNYANDLRQTLKSVFISMATSGDKSMEDMQNNITKGWLTSKQYITFKQHEEPPPWIDDSECTCCSGCRTCFSFFKRRHHCRLCGKIFCSSCASNFVPLPRYGLLSPVRVCTACIETAIERLV